jgi:photosystem II stability/assembly factor-like uncharacterized protein
MKRTCVAVLAALAIAAPALAAVPARSATAPAAPEGKLKSGTFSGLRFRSLGPAINSGRVSDIAIHPAEPNTWYVAVASGNVWKTVNAGTTWTPIFDDQGSFSIGCVAVSPHDPLQVWVGSGENNSQRSVAYGDGLYRSLDGGRTWRKMGLEASEHIAKIVFHPRDPGTLYVASQGPLWAKGGDRGLYKTTDGGATWTRILHVDDWTGASDIAMDPRDPDVLYVVTYQRARRVWSLLNGGPGSGLHKTTDGGKTWTKLTRGLPEGDLGRIGICLSPQDPDVVYALVEATRKESGFYRSLDGGSHFEKRGDYNSQSPQYYQEIIHDPNVEGRIYSMDTWMHVTDDAGKTFRRVGEVSKHVDNHALWIEPANSDHMIAGCDGGVYETFDRGATWRFFANLPITQFYKVEVDNAEPFYNIYGGTQDNNTIGGPSRTNTDHGITNQDWFITVGGDGYQTRVDPTDPNIVYSMWQYGGLVRHDRRTGEVVDLQPQPAPGEPALRWNWDSPLVLSPHRHTRLYFAAQRLFRSDDRGDTWTPVSPDLTRQIDRNRLQIMDRVWSVDAVAKNASTSFYGNIVALSESPLQEGLLYVGTDDGLIQVTEDGGRSWRRIERFPGVPELSYVRRAEASRHKVGRVFGAFENHKMGDFRPYLLRSDDFGRTWVSIAGDLPARGSLYAFAEDHVDPDLLFVGTEFGVFFTRDGGRRWIQLKGGLPTIQVRDMAVQRRENDLVLGTFGRGYYVLDDYSPLRRVNAAMLDSAAVLLPVKPAKAFVPRSPLGGAKKASQGDAFFIAPNPPDGAVLTYYLGSEIRTRAKQRRERESEVAKKGGAVYYPSWDSLRAEDREEEPVVLLTVTDEDGQVVRRLTGPVKAGFHRIEWDLRYPAAEPVNLKPVERAPWDQAPAGPLVTPGTYRVTMALRVEGVVRETGQSQAVAVEPLLAPSLPVRDRAALLAFQQRTARLQRAVLGAARIVREAQDRVAHLKKAIDDTPGTPNGLGARVRAIENGLRDVQVELSGDPTVASRNEPVPPGILDRVQRVVGGHWYTTTDATNTHRSDYDFAADAFERLLPRLRTLLDTDLRGLEREAESAGAPWTPGRLPDWRRSD